jgi:hypothetical protein
MRSHALLRSGLRLVQHAVLPSAEVLVFLQHCSEPFLQCFGCGFLL